MGKELGHSPEEALCTVGGGVTDLADAADDLDKVVCCRRAVCVSPHVLSNLLDFRVKVRFAEEVAQEIMCLVVLVQ